MVAFNYRYELDLPRAIPAFNRVKNSGELRSKCLRFIKPITAPMERKGDMRSRGHRLRKGGKRPFGELPNSLISKRVKCTDTNKQDSLSGK